jgi:cyclic pyranopterin monophosphate synthase
LRDISAKTSTLRTAHAQATLSASKASLDAIKNNTVPKGDPLPVAKVAAIQAAKNTSQIIPYCHPLPVEFVGVEYELTEDRITIDVVVKAIYKTGVEMEALTAASVAALTIYDMLKMIDEEMEILSVRLLKKTGGKSDFKNKATEPLRAAVLVMSDSISEGKKVDESGKLIRDRLQALGLEIADYRIIPDDQSEIEQRLKIYADEDRLDLVVTTGGTGLSPRDRTPEAMANVIEREAPGIAESARAHGQQRTPYSMLSRGRAGVRGRTLIVNLPGSRNGVSESMDALFPGLLHSFNMMRAGGHHQCSHK